MTRKQLNSLKLQIESRREKATDLDILVAQIMELPYGQMKKVLTEEVLNILEKYGYEEV